MMTMDDKKAPGGKRAVVAGIALITGGVLVMAAILGWLARRTDDDAGSPAENDSEDDED
jgi:hypothetical protein